MLRAALDEIAQTGYAQLTMEGIARRAGVNKSTLYRRWGDRENVLLDAFLDRGRRQVPIPDTGSLRDDLLAIARAVAANLRSPDIEAGVRAVAAARGSDSALIDATRRFWAERFALDGAVLERAIERGEAAPGTNPKTVIETVLAPIYFRLLVTREPVDRDFVARVVDLAVAGVAPCGTRLAA